MGEFFFEYGIFLAKAVTIIASVAAILILMAAFSRRGSSVVGLSVEKLNSLENAPRASGPTPSRAPVYRRFFEASRLITGLSLDRVISFEFETREARISSPLPIGSIRGNDLVNAAKAGAEFKAGPDGQLMELSKKKRILVLRFGRRAADSPNPSRTSPCHRC